MVYVVSWSFQLYINCEINVSPVWFTVTSSKLVIWLHSVLSSFRQLTCITSRCWWNYNHMFPPQIVSKGARSQENTHAPTRAQLPIRGVSNKRERSCFLSVIIDGWWLCKAADMRRLNHGAPPPKNWMRWQTELKWLISMKYFCEHAAKAKRKSWMQS